MYILGISAFYHDSAACLIDDGEIIAAAQEERFTRIKYDANFPVNAITYCLAEVNLTPDKIDTSSLPPMAYTCLPNLVFVNKKCALI